MRAEAVAITLPRDEPLRHFTPQRLGLVTREYDGYENAQQRAAGFIPARGERGDQPRGSLGAHLAERILKHFDDSLRLVDFSLGSSGLPERRCLRSGVRRDASLSLITRARTSLFDVESGVDCRSMAGKQMTKALRAGEPTGANRLGPKPSIPCARICITNTRCERAVIGRPQAASDRPAPVPPRGAGGEARFSLFFRDERKG